MVGDLNAKGTGSIFYNNPALHGIPVYQDPDGNAAVPTPGVQSTYITAGNFGTLNIPLLAGGALRTDGLDLGANYRLETKDISSSDWGTFNLFASANVLFNYDIKLAGGQWMSYKGQYTDAQAVAAAQGLMPDYSITTGLTYSFFNFDYTIIAHYLPGVTDYGDLHPSVGAPANDFTVSGNPFEVQSYFKIDMQLAYNLRSESGKKWYDNTRIAVGCNNITGERPNLIASSSEDNTDKSSYDIIGRFVYFEVSKKF